MSWDVSFFASESPPEPISDMPKDWKGSALGSPAEVREKISICLPDVDWADPNWGRFEGDGFSYEFNLGQDDPCVGFMVHVRGDGDAVALLLDLALKCKWYALDISQGEWMHHCTDTEVGWESFQAYRDQVLGREE